MGPLRGCSMLPWLLLLCAALLPGARGLAPKVACGFRDPLCSLKSRFEFGSAVVGNTVYYSGGLDANNPTYPLPGSYLETIDLGGGAFAPRVLQAVPDAALNTSRYRHQLAPWRDGKIAVVGGQFDDRNGASQKCMSLIVLDLATREYELRRSFWQTNKAELIWSWAEIYGDLLFMAVDDFGGVLPDGAPRPVDDMSRSLYVYNMSEPRKGKDLLGLTMLAPGIMFLDMPVVAGTALDDATLLIWQSGRSIANTSQVFPMSGNPVVIPVVVLIKPIIEKDDQTQASLLPNLGPLRLPAGVKRAPGGTGGTILAAKLVNRGGLQLFLWANTNATFDGDAKPSRVQLLATYSVDLTPGKGGTSMALTAVNALVAPPPGRKISQITGLDLPLAGMISLSADQITSGFLTEMPYVGDVDLISDLDTSNVAIDAVPGGLFIRGNSKPSDACVSPTQVTAEQRAWKPFIMSVTLPAAGPPKATAVGAYAWCSRAQDMQWLDDIQEANFKLKGMRGMHAVGDPRQLLLVSPRMLTVRNYFFQYKTNEPLQGAILDPVTRDVAKFNVTAAEGFKFPRYVGACVTRPRGGQGQVYLEYGGAVRRGTPKDDVLSAISVMPVPPAAGDAACIAPAAASGGALPARAQAAVACAPDGRMWAFGGLRDAGTAAKTVYAPTSDLSAATLDGAGSYSAATQQAQAGAAWPAARYGAGMVYLAPGVVGGMPDGALLLYGGSNGSDPELGKDYVDNMTSSPLLGDSWLYDLSGRRWERLRAGGDAPLPMMWHAASAGDDGRSALMYGGRVYIKASNSWDLDNSIYILEFPLGGGAPLWRRAPVDNQERGSALKTEFPNTAIVPLDGGLVALQHEQDIRFAPAPKSTTLSGSSASIAAEWAAATADLTSGDWVMLAPEGGVLELDAPLTISGDIVVTGNRADAARAAAAVAMRTGGVASNAPGGAVAAVPVGAGGARRGLMAFGAPGGAVTLKCGKRAGTAFVIMSAGALLKDMTITGCNDTAVRLLPDPSQWSGRYPEAYPVRIENATLTRNPGSAVRMANGTAAALAGVEVSRNGAGGGSEGYGALFAEAGSLLALRDSVLAANNGSAVNFRGVKLSAERCAFTRNAAENGAGVYAVFVPPPAALYATEDTGTVVPPTGELHVTGCRFSHNEAAGGGGGLFVGDRMSAFVVGSVFVENRASEGAGAHAARDGCLELLRGSAFARNAATERGGGILSRAPLCSRSAMLWDRISVANNTAGGDGGGAYVSEAAFRMIHIANSSFAGNCANGTLPPRAGGAGAGGDGGGLYLGTWSSRVRLSGTGLAGNFAARSGGGVHAIMLSQDDAVDLEVTNCTATLNAAGRVGAAGRPLDPYAEGGALRVLGSMAAVVLNGSAFESNAAGQGGGVSFGADRGSLAAVGGSSFTRNTAAVAGGGVLAGESSSVVLEGVEFADNTASGPEPFFGWSNDLADLDAARAAAGGDAAAGGGFYCFRCYSARVVNCTFLGNLAGAYGGGAAIVQPLGGAAIVGADFAGNAAGNATVEAVRRRRLLAGEAGAPQAAGPAPECGPGGTCANAGFNLGGWATTVDVANPIGDDGKYGGGGGLYVSTLGPVNVSDSHFTGNRAQSGGGMIARTDMCPPGAASCQLWLLGKSNSFQSNTAGAGAGGGLLITKLTDDLVKLPACGALTGETAFRECLGSARPRTALRLAAGGAAPAAPAAPAAGGDTMTAGRALLAGALAPLNDVSSQGYGEDLASAAATAHFLSVGNVTLDDAPITYRASSAPGGLVPVSLRLRDRLARDVQGDISDASMIMQVVLYTKDGKPQPRVTRLGNISRAANGTLSFASLQVFATPGEYLLSFAPLDPLNRVLTPANLSLSLRHCVAGEASQGLSPGDPQDSLYREARVDFKCEQCRFGTYSLDPEVPYCIQCKSSTNANCTGASLIPADGFWQSHPRSPVIHRCLVDVACMKSEAKAEKMYQWALRRADMSVAQLDAPGPNGTPLYLDYTRLECNDGYQGILCGECARGYGRRGYRCVSCERRWVNNLYYALACAYMIALVILAGFMHARQVEKRQRAAAGAGAAAFAAAGGGPGRGAARIGGEGAGTRGGGAGAGPPEESEDGPGARVKVLTSVSSDTAQDSDAGGGRGADIWGAGPPVERIPESSKGRKDQSSGAQKGKAPPAGKRNGRNNDGDGSSGGGRDLTGSSNANGRDDLGRASEGAGAGGFKMYDSLRSPYEDPKNAPPGTGADGGALQPAHTGFQGGASWLQGLFSVDTMRSAPATLHAPGSVTDPQAAAAAARAHARSRRFWVSDILKLLITHLQLLGLLRGLRINWPPHLEASVSSWLAFFDQTSTVSTWVSLDCSLSEDEPGAAVRRSVKRTLVMLLMPVFGTLLGLVFWGVHALVVRSLKGRRAALRMLTWRTYYQPRVIMTIVLVMFYLYPQVSNAVVSIFSCAVLDHDLSSFISNSRDPGLELKNLKGTALVANAAAGYWSQDTAYVCMAGTHKWLFGLGVVWTVLFCVGFPAAMAAVLYKNRNDLEETKVDMRYGFFYDSYHNKYYFWESIILVEKLLMVIAITLLQRYTATAQVLVALIVISLATVLQITFRPSGCNMLHTLQRASLYVLQATLFMLMLSNLSEVADSKVILLALAIAAALNLGLVVMFLYAFGIEVRRLLMVTIGKDPIGKLHWSDVSSYLRTSVFGTCLGGRRQQEQQQQQQQQHPAAAAATVAAPPPAQQVPTIVIDPDQA